VRDSEAQGSLDPAVGVAWKGAIPDDSGVGMTRQYIIAAIVGIILVTSLRLGAFPAATAVAMTLTGATVILMMAWEGWP